MVFFGVVGCERKSSGGDVGDETFVEREISTPSGDWTGCVVSAYGEDGEFVTLGGYDSGNVEFLTTRCVREYWVSAEGELVLEFKVVTDLASGEVVECGFYDPEFVHWMTLGAAEEGVADFCC